MRLNIKNMTLLDLKLGQSAYIKDVKSDIETLCRELQELGFTPGTEVSLVSKGLFGNPLAFKVRGTVFALRKYEADAIQI